MTDKTQQEQAVEALREALAALELLLPTAQQFEKQASKGTGGRRGGPVFTKARAAIDSLQSAIAALQAEGREAVAWVAPGALAHLAKQNGPAHVPAWNCGSGTERVPLYTHPQPTDSSAVTWDAHDAFEQFLAAEIDAAPKALRRLGEWLTQVLDDDQWATANRMLLGAVMESNRQQPTASSETGTVWVSLETGRVFTQGAICPPDAKPYVPASSEAGPEHPDGCDSEGFAGGCERMGHTPETCPKSEGGES